MPTRSEIKFIDWWDKSAGQDGLVTRAQIIVSMPMPLGSGWSRFAEPVKRDENGDVLLLGLNPAGHDLIETAKVAGVPTIADDEHPSVYIDCDPDSRVNYDDCAYCAGDACHRHGWKRERGESRPCDCDVDIRHTPPGGKVSTCLTCDGKREIPILGSFANPCPDCGDLDAEQRAALFGEIDEELRMDAGNPWVTERGAMLDFFREATKSYRSVCFKLDRIGLGPMRCAGAVLGVDRGIVKIYAGGQECYLGTLRCTSGWISAVRYESNTASSNPSSATV